MKKSHALGYTYCRCAEICIYAHTNSQAKHLERWLLIVVVMDEVVWGSIAHNSQASWFKMSCHKSAHALGNSFICTFTYTHTHLRWHVGVHTKSMYKGVRVCVVVRTKVVESRQLCITPSIPWSVYQVESLFGLFYAACNCGWFAHHTAAWIYLRLQQEQHQ